MLKSDNQKTVAASLKDMAAAGFTPLDLLPQATMAEKLIELVLAGPPAGPPTIVSDLAKLAGVLAKVDTADLKVVVFGGGTGLANMVGGDSRSPDWPRSPFVGLKSIFPKTTALVCVTDDGGSTGQLLKDLPLIALGDLRHVLLSSICFEQLTNRYHLSSGQVRPVVEALHALFNFRYTQSPATADILTGNENIDLAVLPAAMRDKLHELLDIVFSDERFKVLLRRPNCLGNLLLAAAIYQQSPDCSFADPVPQAAVSGGLMVLCDCIGAYPSAVLPCTTTPAQLKVMYANGVLVTGEHKSSQALRGCAVDRVFVEFVGPPQLLPEVEAAIVDADIILFAPGSLYTSIIPVLQVPGIAEAVRRNKNAMKVLIANLWGQRGETDLVRDDPNRRFYVSDLLNAYQRNIPGGVADLFREVVVLGLQDIPGNILQSYAFENKVPIYLDRERVTGMGFNVIETKVFSQQALEERKVVQHDPTALAKSIRTLWAIRDHLPSSAAYNLSPPCPVTGPLLNKEKMLPTQRYEALKRRVAEFAANTAADLILDILWRHIDIPLAHLDQVKGVDLVNTEVWCRSQRWDKIFSFYDPFDGHIKIRQDMLEHPNQFEIAFLIALGQSVLGNYAARKDKRPVVQDGEALGHVFSITLREQDKLQSFLSLADIRRYLSLARMLQSSENSNLYQRLINGDEEFTPPGLLFGLTYAWYLDNRFASHVEYKMAVTRAEITDLVPAQVNMAARRQSLTDFFRKQVFMFTEPGHVVG